MTTATRKQLNGRPPEVGDIYQIDPATDDCFGACLLIVTEVKSWGVQGYVQIPGRDGTGGQAYVRKKWQDIYLVGMAEWIRGTADDIQEHNVDTGADGDVHKGGAEDAGC